MIKLYHTDVFMPADLRKRAEGAYFARLVWSRHAQLEILNDRYGVLEKDQIPRSFGPLALDWKLIELEVEDRAYITKYVFRRAVDAFRSLVIVFRPDDCIRQEGVATVVTAWTNLNTDTHNTLDRSKYVQQS